MTYTISDFLNGITIRRATGEEVFDSKRLFLVKLNYQIAILKSAHSKIGTILADITSIIHAELFDNELDAARELLKSGFLRASGTMAGVTLEWHLSNLLNKHNLRVTKKTPSISDLNEQLKKSGVFDVPTRRNIQRLGDLRNLCAHNKNREPTKEEVDELIKEVAKVVKTLN